MNNTLPHSFYSFKSCQDLPQILYTNLLLSIIWLVFKAWNILFYIFISAEKAKWKFQYNMKFDCFPSYFCRTFSQFQNCYHVVGTILQGNVRRNFYTQFVSFYALHQSGFKNIKQSWSVIGLISSGIYGSESLSCITQVRKQKYAKIMIWRCL